MAKRLATKMGFDKSLIKDWDKFEKSIAKLFAKNRNIDPHDLELLILRNVIINASMIRAKRATGIQGV